jgi:glycosyltransferase involved in cell wall biosynthesis
MPPSRSGIADYSALLLPALRERIREVVVAEPGKRAPRADIALYHVGNDPDAHGWIVDALRERPGVVVLHELVIHHLIAGMTIGRGNGRGYMEAMERDFGVPGRLLALGVLDNLLPLIWETQPERFPLTGTVLDLASGLIVHSAYVERGVREAGYGGPLWRIPHAAWPEQTVEPAADVSGDPLVGCFGHQNMNKRIPSLLEAFTLLRKRRPGAKLLLVGVPTERFDLDRRLERLGIGGDELIREGYVTEQRFNELMAACDVLVNLRSPTMGETSGSVIRALALGKPMLVSDLGWFSELPAGVALKIPVDEYEVPTIAAAIELAADHAAELGASAQEYVRREHDLDRVADAYVAALEEAAGGEEVTEAVIGQVAEAAAGIGIDDPAEIARLAREAGIV